MSEIYLSFGLICSALTRHSRMVSRIGNDVIIAHLSKGNTALYQLEK
jgi:hypothetical protein